MALTPGARFGSYEVVEPIGSPGFAAKPRSWLR